MDDHLTSSSWDSDATTLSLEEIDRYNRAMLIPEVGPVTYERMLRKTSVLVIGAGGLGSTCCLYLAAGGVQRLGIVDSDTVEITNLHRQIIHTTDRAGMSKVDSAVIACRALNPLVTIDPYPNTRVHADNVLGLVSKYDIVVDATDNIPARYVISDACVMTGKPLVSGAAVCWDGQLLILNNGPDCPCYRCLHPTPPPIHTVQSCGDVGVLGPIPGAIGALMAMEVQKLAMGIGESLTGRMLHFDGQRGRSFVVKLRARDRVRCAMCRDVFSISNEENATTDVTNREPDLSRGGNLPLREYQEYACPKSFGLPPLSIEHVLPASHLTHAFMSRCVVVDVRSPLQFALCRFPRHRCRALYNIPLETMQSDPPTLSQENKKGQEENGHPQPVPQNGIRALMANLQELYVREKDIHKENGNGVARGNKSDHGGHGGDDERTIVTVTLLVVCRRGITSTHAVPVLLQWKDMLTQVLQATHPSQSPHALQILNLQGGLNGYAKHVDVTFPIY